MGTGPQQTPGNGVPLHLLLAQMTQLATDMREISIETAKVSARNDAVADRVEAFTASIGEKVDDLCARLERLEEVEREELRAAAHSARRRRQSGQGDGDSDDLEPVARVELARAAVRAKALEVAGKVAPALLAALALLGTVMQWLGLMPSGK